MLEQLLTIPSSDNDVQRRARCILSIALVMLGLIGIAAVAVLFRSERGPSVLGLIIATGVIAGAMALAHRGLVGPAAWTLVLTVIGAVMAPVLLRPGITSVLFYLALPMVIAGIVLRPRQVWIVLAVELLIMAVKTRISPLAPMAQMEVGVLLVSSYMVLATLGVISFLNAKITTGAFAEAADARSAAEAAAGRLEELNHGLERQVQARTAELRQALEDAHARADEKQALLDEIANQRAAIREMSVPVLPVSADTLVMPLVGDIDDARLGIIQTQALGAIERAQARTLLIDLTGVALVDAQVAQGLLRTIQAARLLGVAPVLIGIRPEVAQAIVGLGVDLGEVRTAASLESALSQGKR